MKTINEIRSEVMTLAWKLVKCEENYYGGTLSGCMKEAWKRVKKSLKPETKGYTKVQIKNMLMDISNGYQLTFKNLDIWSIIMEKADEVGHFASDIVEKVVCRNMNNGISEKQAWAVAYFAQNNGLI